MKLFCYTVAMKFSLSSSYFAGRRYTPDVMVAQTVALGFDAVELGYFTREVELDAWQMALAREGVSVSSIHAFCPMPLEMPQLGPEVFSLAAPEHEERQAAIRAMLRTLEAAVRFGARAVVTHGGRVELREPARLFGRRPYRSRLSQSLEQLGFIDESLVERERAFRESAAPKWLDAVSFSLEVRHSPLRISPGLKRSRILPSVHFCVNASHRPRLLRGMISGTVNVRHERAIGLYRRHCRSRIRLRWVYISMMCVVWKKTIVRREMER